MKKVIFLIFALTLILPGAAAAGGRILKLATTTSTQASGLLDHILPSFEKKTGIRVKVIARGTGAALRAGMDGNVDVILVHARKREEKFVKEGFGTKRFAVMHNDFVILGPAGDPAGVKGATSVADAMKRIARGGFTFVSRGDDSGTHTKERALWKASGIETAKRGSWYLSIGQGMGKTLTFADEKEAYTLSDRGTYIRYRFGRKEKIDLEVLYENDPLLANPYGVIPVNPKRHPHVSFALAEKFVKWLTGKECQKKIADYRIYGQQLFFPDNL